MESQPVVSKVKNPNLDNLIKLLESLGKTFENTSDGYKYKEKEVTTTTEVAGTTDAALKQIVPIIFDALVAGISTFNQSLEESEHQEDLLAVITDASGKMATPETLNGLFDKINLGPITLETVIQYESILKAFGIKNISETTAGLASINGIPALLAAIQRIDIKDEATARLSLSLKQLTKDPFFEASLQYSKDEEVVGTVSRITPYGIFITLKNGVEGLMHISKIPPNESYEVGQKVTCAIESIDSQSRRISLSPVVKEKPILYR